MSQRLRFRFVVSMGTAQFNKFMAKSHLENFFPLV
jgi:hypothetical protein